MEEMKEVEEARFMEKVAPEVYRDPDGNLWLEIWDEERIPGEPGEEDEWVYRPAYLEKITQVLGNFPVIQKKLNTKK